MLVRDDFPGRRFVDALVDLPFALPTIVAGLILLALYGDGSPLGLDLAYTRAGVALALLFVTLPFVVRSVQPVLADLDPEVEEAAATLGAGGWTTFRRVLLPTLLPALVAGGAQAFARALGEFGSVVLISGNLPYRTEVASWWIFTQVENGAPEAGAAVAVVLLADRAPRRGAPARWSAVGPRDADERPARTPGGGAALLALVVLAPVAMIVVRTFSHGLAPVVAALTTPEALHAIQLSLLVTAIAVPINTVFGVVCAFVLVRYRPPGSGLIAAVVDLPFAVSPVVLGLALVVLYGAQGWFGPWLGGHQIHVIFALPGMVLATVFVSLPFVVGEVAPVLAEAGTDAEDAAATLGASRWRTFRRVTLPAIRWGVTYGVVLTTARALGEYGAVAIVSGSVLGVTRPCRSTSRTGSSALDLTGAFAAGLLLGSSRSPSSSS